MNKWRALDWIDPRYEVSDAGDVRSWTYRNGAPGRAKRPHKLQSQISNSGYRQVRLPVGDTFKWVSIARCVLRAFTGSFGPQTNHIDGDRQNDALSNLEWCTMSENMRHSYRVLGRVHPRPALGKFGALNPHSIPVTQLQLDGTVVRVWPSMADAARAGFRQPNVWAVCNNHRKQCGGFRWQYANQSPAK